MLRWFMAGVCASLVLFASSAFGQGYKLTADSIRQEGVPKGDVISFKWKSKIYAGTERDCWLYIPKQYDPKTPACVMIFQDGGGYVSEGGLRATIAFDNLIHKKEMPVTIGIFLNPGIVPASRPDALPRYNRSLEYDGLGDTYARFLLEEILPEVSKKYNLTKDPSGRALCGISSGGICAFTAAWERPDQFQRVLSMIGSFTNLRGSQDYPSLIRKMEPKPLRVYLQEGSNDQDIYSGSWYISNLDMMWALRYARYDYKWELGNQGHSGEHGTAILPDALRWLWRDYPKPIEVPRATPQPVMEVLLPQENWRAVEGDYVASGALTTDAQGNVFFADNTHNRIMKVSNIGTLSVEKENVGGVRALHFSPDGGLVAAVEGGRRLVTWNAQGEERVLAQGVQIQDFTISNKGEIFATEATSGKIWLLSGKKGKKLLVSGVVGANYVQLTPDQTLLIVGHSATGGNAYKGTKGEAVPPVSLSSATMLTSYQVQKDSTLAYEQLYFDLALPHEVGKSAAGGMAVDTQGRLYVTSNVGIQFCDQAGRVNGIIANPNRLPTTQVTFGGSQLDTLYVVAGGRVYARKTKAKGVLSMLSPMRPPQPRL
jgi:enterochelin esterase-like enzyme/sugar lactone lactonase YvrE